MLFVNIDKPYINVITAIVRNIDKPRPVKIYILYTQEKVITQVLKGNAYYWKPYFTIIIR